MNKLKHGKIHSQISIGDDVKADRTVAFKEGIQVDERLRYEERHRVGSLDEAMHKVVELARRVEEDESLIDPAWRYEGRALFSLRKRFDIVFCYTKIMGNK